MQDYSEIQSEIEIKFKDPELLDKAFVHRSYLNESNDKTRSNERLEFLGDAVLELVSTKHLFLVCPNRNEGEMTSFRSALVKGETLSQIARRLNLGKYLYLSRGEERSGGREKDYILANTVEALIGAIYLDQGYAISEKFIEKYILAKLDEIIKKGLHIDAKSHFQEIAQEKAGITPHYELIDSEGPDHDKIFTMGVYIGEELIATGQGQSKQKAESAAAEAGLAVKNWR